MLVFVASLPAVTTRIYSSDEIEYFSYLRSIWFDHDVSFENEYQYFYDRDVARAEGFHETFLERETEAGRRPNFGTIGSALLWSPFYAAADLSVRAGARPAATWPPTASRRPYVAAVAYGSAFYGFLAVLLTIGRRGGCWSRRRRRGRRGRSRGSEAPRDPDAAPRGAVRRLARHAAALLYVRRAADVARLLGVRGGAVRRSSGCTCASTGRVRRRHRAGSLRGR